MLKKKNLVLLFGGQSSEHDISRISATTIATHVDKRAYAVIPVGITREGSWLLYEGALENIKDPDWMEGCPKAVLSPDGVDKALLVEREGRWDKVPVDVVFPVLHGLYGEDGSVQGLLELARIPYVGCGILASSISMDKLYTKIVVENLGIRQARYVKAALEDVVDVADLVEEVEEKLGYPVFVKPANAGSSMGVSKAEDEDSLQEAIAVAFEHDRKILIEERIVGREIECAVLGNYNPKASGVGEILAAADFYDFDAKYNNAQSQTVISPKLPEDVEETVRESAVSIFKAVDGTGLARVDFFLEQGSNELVFNEINTMPGFTGISMYPMLWKAQGVELRELVETLLNLAFQRMDRNGR
ncbi:D-alanine--D-alanine ligase family protein [Anaerotalea alkaliphila]|uniref:D-alanine--D-alanine ligase family protein n=1 Tax=Anaerotalea alkaliphila TaxID=2662126 RepID=UPI003CCD64D5